MTRVLNTAHRNDPTDNYTLPPLERLPSDITDLIDGKFYFVLSAPRQSGKTTSMMALAEHIRAEGHYAAVCGSAESIDGKTDVAEALLTVCDSLSTHARLFLPATDQGSSSRFWLAPSPPLTSRTCGFAAISALWTTANRCRSPMPFTVRSSPAS